jgi:hypothetical protein
MLTQTDLEDGYNNPQWSGFGYLGARRNALQDGDHEAPPQPALVAAADAYLIRRANRLGWTAADLFRWANSKLGRWYGDVWFGNDQPYRQRHAVGLVRLPND